MSRFRSLAGRVQALEDRAFGPEGLAAALLRYRASGELPPIPRHADRVLALGGAVGAAVEAMRSRVPAGWDEMGRRAGWPVYLAELLLDLDGREDAEQAPSVRSAKRAHLAGWLRVRGHLEAPAEDPVEDELRALLAAYEAEAKAKPEPPKPATPRRAFQLLNDRRQRREVPAGDFHAQDKLVRFGWEPAPDDEPDPPPPLHNGLPGAERS